MLRRVIFVTTDGTTFGRGGPLLTCIGLCSSCWRSAAQLNSFITGAFTVCSCPDSRHA